jgi:hypothetical protein
MAADRPVILIILDGTALLASRKASPHVPSGDES